MLSHKHIWSAIDALAARYGHSPSGLARAAGLDPTTFNKSKRLGPQGRLRWPSTESLAKILQVTGATIEDFVALLSRGSAARAAARTLPLLKLKDLTKKRLFDAEGKPVAKAWDRLAFPDVNDEAAFAVEITGNAAAPVLRKGAVIVVAPGAELRRDDLVLVKAKGACVVMRLARRTAKKLKLKSLNPSQPDRLVERSAVELMGRVVWARH
jgi:phage repressor protein C with HTH and peptisase S24 domain